MYVVRFAYILEWSRPLSGWFCILMDYNLYSKVYHFDLVYERAESGCYSHGH